MTVPTELTKDLIKEIEAKLRKRLEELNTELAEDEDSFQESLPADSKEAAPMLDELEVIRADNHRDTEEVDAIRKAINNIHSGDYGNCANCNQSIAVKRLLAMPHALLCIKCQTEEENEAE